jgi:hypothetical protein
MALATRTNGIRPDFSSSRFTINGERYYTLKALNYSFESKKKPVYGQPRVPLGYTAGQVTFTASMELLREEFLRLLDDLSNGGQVDPTLVEFDIVHSISFGTEPIQTDKMERVTINKGDQGFAQGEEPDVVKVDLNICGLVLNGIRIGGEATE